MNYKVSYILSDASSPGMTILRDTYPQLGETVQFQNKEYAVREVVALSPVKDESQFLLVKLDLKTA